jgi:hypothetical protein
MYGDNREIFENLSYIAKGNIYFIAERKKIRISPGSVSVSEDGYVSLTFIGDDSKQIPVKYPFAPTIIGLGSKFSEIYGNADTLQRYIIGVKNHRDYEFRQGKGSVMPFIGIALDSAAQTKRNIALRLYTPDGQDHSFALPIHAILSHFEIDIGDSPRIIYIGKSQDLNDRIYRHEKIQEALATINDENDLYLYAFQFNVSKIIEVQHWGRTTDVTKEEVSDVSMDDQISIIEMSLINYFKPAMNKDYKNADIPKNPIFQSALKGRYHRVHLEVIYEGGFWNFGTEHIRSSLKHNIIYQVK